MTRGVVVGGVVAVLALAGCGGGGSKAVDMKIANFHFPAVQVKHGGTIHITTTDEEGHTVTADDGSFTTDIVGSNHPQILTAPKRPGTYRIHCTVHPTMHGSITVT